MKKIIRSGLLLLTFLSYGKGLEARTDTVMVERIILSNSAKKITGDFANPGASVETVINKDKLIWYHADIGIVNPTKKKYEIEINCVDSKGKIVFKGILKRSFGIKDDVDGEVISRVTQTLGLDPKSGAIVKGQLIPLENNNDYFIKLYVEKNLIGVTKFHYIIEK
jgi:hypothetical protein